MNCDPIKRPLSRESRIEFLNEFRDARAKAQKNSEDFEDLLFAIERLGQFLSIDERGSNAKSCFSLKSYKSALEKLATECHLSEACRSTWQSAFSTLYDLVQHARNDAMHVGARARHLTEHAIELALIFEDALTMAEPSLNLVSDLMVRNPIIAEPWQPISFVRRAMLTNSFSFLPFLWQDKWRLLSDQFVAEYLQSIEDRRIGMAQSVEEAINNVGTDLVPLADYIEANQPISKVFDFLRQKRKGTVAEGYSDALSMPMIVLIPQTTGIDLRFRVVGIITPFDML